MPPPHDLIGLRDESTPISMMPADHKLRDLVLTQRSECMKIVACPLFARAGFPEILRTMAYISRTPSIVQSLRPNSPIVSSRFDVSIGASEV